MVVTAYSYPALYCGWCEILGQEEEAGAQRPEEGEEVCRTEQRGRDEKY